MKKILFLLFLTFSAVSTLNYAQTTDVGGLMSNHPKANLKPLVESEEMPEFDLSTVMAANEINAANKVGPYMFGYEHHVNYSMDVDGQWDYLNNGSRIWRFKVSSADALSINLVFNVFELPEGAHLHIYNADQSMIVGAYTSANNNENQVLGTELIKGDEAIIEYYEPADKIGLGKLNLGMVVHGYIDINGWYTEKVNESGACNLDVICSDGIPWASEIKSVARILNGGGLCTGTLVNNTLQDGTPYFLTANHCGPQNMGSAVFRFNYDSPVCGSQTSANSQAPLTNNSINGSTLKARKADSDFGLVELNSTPPASYGVYYAGWDNSGNIPSLAVGIHHPSGDVKKISFDDDPLQSAQGLSSVNNSSWRIEQWERNTTTEGGSSGSGLWDGNHRIVGQLHGGQANCSNSINDYYGKFSMSWDGNGSGSSSQRLSDWLDPNSSGAVTLDGYDPNAILTSDDAAFQGSTAPTGSICSDFIEPVVILKNAGNNPLTSCTITYDIDGGSPMTYSWTGNLASGTTTSVSLPGIIANGMGSHAFNATISNPNGVTDNNPANNNLIANFTSFGQAGDLYLNLDLDCFGSEVSWYITEQGSSDKLYEGGSYPDVSGGQLVVEELCLPNGCYTFVIEDSWGDGLNGSSANSCTVDGNYNLEDFYQNEFFNMGANPNYGDSQSHNFCVTSTGMEKSDVLAVKVFPNPAKDLINIDFRGLEDVAAITITDLNGKLVTSQMKSTGSDFMSLPLDRLEQGMYFLTISTADDSIVKKFVKK